MADTKREREEQLALANMLSKIVLSSTNMNELTEGFATELKRFMSIDWGGIAGIEKGDSVRLMPLSSKISFAADFESPIPVEKTPVAWVAENKRALLESDLSKTSQPWTISFLSKLGKQEIKSMAFMPLFSRGEVFGSLVVGSHKPDVYRERELKLLKYAATQLATPLKSFLLAEESRKEGIDWFRAISHYTKTPLTPIVSSSELLVEELQTQPESPIFQLAQNVQKSAQSLHERLDLFEKMAQVELSQTPPKPETFAAKEMLSEVAGYAESKVTRKSQFFTLKLPSDLPQIFADTQKLKEVLNILLGNAIDRSPERGKIELRAKATQNELIVEVIDSGPIFSPEEKKALLEPYRPSQADHLLFPELSLSLAICRRIVELHGGKFWLESEPDSKTTFSFSLPL
jgi:signal transduction histidine kinase